MSCLVASRSDCGFWGVTAVLSKMISLSKIFRFDILKFWACNTEQNPD
jgi:hypothetical protein